MTEILYGLQGAQRERVAALREGGRFFWLDVSLSETSLDDLVEALDIPERASQALASYGEADGPSREFQLGRSPPRVHHELLHRASGGVSRAPTHAVP